MSAFSLPGWLMNVGGELAGEWGGGETGKRNLFENIQKISFMHIRLKYGPLSHLG